MPTIELSAGPIEYVDSGTGPTVVLLHGLLMDGAVFDQVVRDLRRDHRCVVPTLPVGSHKQPMRPEADLSLRGLGAIVAEFLERLDLRDVTLVQNDLAVACMVATEWPERLAGLVLASCEAFENYPPGLPGKNIALTARIPGALNLAMQLMRIRPLRRLPIATGWLAKTRIPHELSDAWFRPVQTNREVRRDLAKYVRTASPTVTMELMDRLRSFAAPTLIVWAREDRIMPVEHGRRLAALMPDSEFVEVSDSYTLIPFDQPERFADLVRDFIATKSARASRGGRAQ